MTNRGRLSKPEGETRRKRNGEKAETERRKKVKRDVVSIASFEVGPGPHCTYAELFFITCMPNTCYPLHSRGL